jgi:hypothetical protein
MRLTSKYKLLSEEELKNNTNSDDYHLPEDDNHHSHRRGNLKSYNTNSATTSEIQTSPLNLENLYFIIGEFLFVGYLMMLSVIETMQY